MSAWSMKFDDELERIGYRVKWEANGNYVVYAPNEVYITVTKKMEDARTAAYSHWQKSNSPVEKLSQEIHRLHQELDARQAEMDRLRAELVTFAIIIHQCVGLSELMTVGYDTKNGNALLKRAEAYMKNRG